MDPTLSILHISDLHRERNNEIATSVLLSSLRKTIDGLDQLGQPIHRPDIAIVSGDIVVGASPDTTDPPTEIKRQYEQSAEFLAKLCKWLFNDDHKRIVLIPGNHDIAFYKSFESIARESIHGDPTAANRKLREELKRHDSEVRFCWESLSYHRVVNRDEYAKRYSHFRDFYDSFYAEEGCKYSLEPSVQYAIHDYPSLNLTVLALNSCFHNDHLNKQGKINPECVALACDKLRSPQFASRLKIAVWHHNLAGKPLDDDYLDSQFVQNLINDGFSVGLHGHQHKNEFVRREYEFDSESCMTIFSAGSLCAGSWAMPLGQTRSFNIVEFDCPAAQGRLNVFAMMNDDLLNPIWGPGTIRQSGTSCLDFEICNACHLSPGEFDRRLDEAMELMDQGRLDDAISVLNAIHPDVHSRRELLIHCLMQKTPRSDDQTSQLLALLDPPQSAAEAIKLIEVLREANEEKVLKSLLMSELVANATDPALVSLRDVCLARMKK